MLELLRTNTRVVGRRRPAGTFLRRRRVIWSLALALLSVFAWSSGLSAHAYLEKAEPAPDSVLAAAPDRLTLWFTETLEPNYSEVVVLNVAGAPVAGGPVRISADRLSMTLPLAPLPEGSYTVSWKTLSTVDGHGARGFYSLTIGTATVPTTPAAVTPSVAADPPLALSTLARWLSFAGQALVAGLLVFALVVLRPVLGQRALTAAARRRQGGLLALGLGLSLLGALLAWPVQAVAATGLPLLETLGPPLLVVLDTRYGQVWLARLFLLGLVSAGVVVGGRREDGGTATGVYTLFLALALLLTTSLTSHAAALLEGTLVAIAVDWLHLVATSVWIGGLAGLVLVAPLALAPTVHEERPRLAAQVVGRFSVLGIGSVVVLLLTGALGAALHLAEPSALWTSGYGGALLTKLLLLLPMLGLAAANLLGFRRELAAALAVRRPVDGAASAVWRRIRGAASAELAIGLAILVAAGVLTSLAPARPNTPTAGVRSSERADDVPFTLSVQPALPGDNRFEVVVADAAADIERVQLRLSYLDRDLGEGEITLLSVGPGRYQATGRQLSVAGRWQAEVLIRRTGRDDSRTAVRFTTPPTGAGADAPVPLRLAPTAPVPLLVLAIGLLLVGVGVWQRRRISRAGALMGAGAGATLVAVYLVAIGGLFAEGPAPAGANPIAPTSGSIARGKTLYTANCVACHGASGKGDGPAAAGLNPPVLDLSVHVGAHPDAELFSMVSQGRRGTAMQPFAGRLSTDDRWHLVNYIKTLAGGG